MLSVGKLATGRRWASVGLADAGDKGIGVLQQSVVNQNPRDIVMGRSSQGSFGLNVIAFFGGASGNNVPRNTNGLGQVLVVARLRHRRISLSKFHALQVWEGSKTGLASVDGRNVSSELVENALLVNIGGAFVGTMLASVYTVTVLSVSVRNHLQISDGGDIFLEKCVGERTSDESLASGAERFVVHLHSNLGIIITTNKSQN